MLIACFFIQLPPLCVLNQNVAVTVSYGYEKRMKALWDFGVGRAFMEASYEPQRRDNLL